MGTTHDLACVAALLMLATPAALAQPLPDWASNIRTDHPRLFFNAETWPQVKARALGAEREWYESIKGRVGKLLAQYGDDSEPEARERGPESAWAAFVYRMTGERKYLDALKSWRGLERPTWIFSWRRWWT